MVCDYVNNKKYLITEDIYSKIQWNTSQTTVGEYAGSNIKAECDQFAIDTGIDQMGYVIDTGVGKVFIPTKEQMTGESGGFSFFDSDSKRVANYNGTATAYWTSSVYGHGYGFVHFISTQGTFSSDGLPTSSYGFRPCICIQTS